MVAITICEKMFLPDMILINLKKRKGGAYKGGERWMAPGSARHLLELSTHSGLNYRADYLTKDHCFISCLLV